jgi:isoleucyl-tRNA synthetase
MDFKTEANIIRALGKIIGNGHLHKGASRCTGAWTAVLRWRKRKLSITTKPLRLSTWRSTRSIKPRCWRNLALPTSTARFLWLSGPPPVDPAGQPRHLPVPEFDYALVQVDGQALILAKDLVESVMRARTTTPPGGGERRELELMRFKHPFLDFDVPAILGDHVRWTRVPVRCIPPAATVRTTTHQPEIRSGNR